MPSAVIDLSRMLFLFSYGVGGNREPDGQLHPRRTVSTQYQAILILVLFPQLVHV